MERYEAKIISLVIIFVSILAATLLPIRVEGIFARQGARGRAVLGGISCFSGGLFLATYLLDMAPEVRVLLEANLMTPRGIAYPIPELIIGAGFFLILLMEIAVMTLSNWKQKNKSKKESSTIDSHKSATQVSPCGAGSVEMTVVVDSVNNIALSTNRNNPNADDSAAAVTADDTGDMNNTISGKANAGNTNAGNIIAGITNDGFVNDAQNEETSKNKPAVHEHVDATNQLEKHDGHSHNDFHQKHATRSIILVLALSLDSVFEGMAVGLRTTMQGVWNLMIAIVAHEVVIAFSMGMQLIRHQSKRTVAIIAFFYSIMSPIGGAIGASLMETQGRGVVMDTTNGILQGLTAGIFIYVTFFEILSAEFTQGVTYMRIITTFVGFCVMAALKAIPDGSEDAAEWPVSYNCQTVH